MIIQVRSVSNPIRRDCFIFLILIVEKYIPIIYIVVSVEPAIMDDIFPIIESGPWRYNISFRSIMLEDADIGLNSAIGNISFGNNLISIKEIKSVRILLFTNTVTDIIRANIDGKISKIIFNPSFTPLKNSS